MNGPLPEATVLKLALSPEHLLRLIRLEAVVLVLTVRLALLVADPQTPVTSTV